MGRPKGSKNSQIKGTKSIGGSKDRITSILTKDPPKKRFKLPEHILPLEYPFFIKSYAYGWVLCEVKKPVNGQCIWDNLCYTSGLQNMLKLVVKYGIRVPMDVQELSNKIDHIYNMLEARIDNVEPKDLFKEYNTTGEFLEDFT